MSCKFVIAATGIIAGLTLTMAANAATEAYKTSEGTVVVTGLTPSQRYQVRFLDVQNKSGTRQDKSANSCGEVVVEKAANYKTLVVGADSFDPQALAVKIHERCKPKPASATMQPKGVVPAKTP